MTHSLYHAAVYLYATVMAIAFGATVYETLVVHPAWSRQLPVSIEGFANHPASRLNLPAFWVPTAPLLVLSGLLAVGMAVAAERETLLLVFSVGSATAAVVWTLLYFRPTVTRFMTDFANIPAATLDAAVRRWIALNYVRLVLVTMAWLGVMHAL